MDFAVAPKLFAGAARYRAALAAQRLRSTLEPHDQGDGALSEGSAMDERDFEMPLDSNL